MYKFTFILLLIASLFFFNCEQKSTNNPSIKAEVLNENTLRLDNEFLIKGTIFNAEAETIFLLKNNNDSIIKIDSTIVKHNTFTFKGLAETPSIYTITSNLEHTGFNFLVDNSEINLFLNSKAEQSTTYSTSTIQTDYRVYTEKMSDFKSQGMQLYYGLKGDFSPKKIFQLKQDRSALFKAQSDYVSEFILSHPNSYFSVLLIDEQFNTLTPNTLRKLFDNLSAEIKELAYVKSLDSALIEKESIAKLSIPLNTNPPKNTVTTSGEYRPKAYTISGKNQFGETISLASIPKGKVVLVDFWASWCGPCRATNPNLVQLHRKYEKQGLVILSVSEDKGEAEWINAINADNLTWDYHIIDKNKTIAFRYGVESIPFKLLIDKQGRIASEKISGSKLETRIKQLLAE
ncbi:thioredoxin-like domain-containing protein [Lacinutrix salivirga]